MQDDWIPESCTLPTAERPLRRAEFDDLFAEDVLMVHESSPLQVRLELRAEPDVAARAARLAAKETVCCSLFRFDLVVTDGRVAMVVSTEAPHEAVLAALTERAKATLGT
jgi:hypothetical protein